jgi:threonine aldolase
MNAVVASGVPTTEWTQGFDTAWIDFSKGLGAPMGAVLAGSAELIDEAWRYKQMMGGALRQAGIVAAGALWALEHHVERLAQDHANARVLAEGLAALPGVEIDPASVSTNIVVFRVADAAALCTQLASHGVIMGALDSRTVRAVTHLDVSAEDIASALDVLGAALAPA